MGLGSMTVMHATEGLEGSESVLPGVYSGGFDSLVQRARHVSRQTIVEGIHNNVLFYVRFNAPTFIDYMRCVCAWCMSQ